MYDIPAKDETWMIVYFGEEPTTTVHYVCMDEVPDEEDGHEVVADAAFPDMHGYLLEHPMCAYPGPDCPDEVFNDLTYEEAQELAARRDES